LTSIPMPISWYAYNNYMQCPGKYKAISLMHKPDVQYTHARTVGHLIETIFQNVLKNGWDLETCLVNLGPILDKLTKETAHRAFSRAQVITQVQNNLFESYDRYMGMFGPYLSTHELYTETNLGDDSIEARLDVHLYREGQSIIIDGKSSKHGKKYITPDQLQFQGYCHHKQMDEPAWKMYYFHYAIGEEEEVIPDSSWYARIDRGVQAMLHDTEFEILKEKDYFCWYCALKSSCVTACKQTKPRKDSLPRSYGEVLELEL